MLVSKILPKTKLPKRRSNFKIRVVLTNPKLGASWEGFALEEIIQAQQPDQTWFYAVHSGSELDLLMEVGGKRIGVEFKRADAPTATRSMHLAITDLGLDELWVVYPGSRVYALDERIKVRPLADCLQLRKVSGRNK